MICASSRSRLGAFEPSQLEPIQIVEPYLFSRARTTQSSPTNSVLTHPSDSSLNCVTVRFMNWVPQLQSSNVQFPLVCRCYFYHEPPLQLWVPLLTYHAFSATRHTGPIKQWPLATTLGFAFQTMLSYELTLLLCWNHPASPVAAKHVSLILPSLNAVYHFPMILFESALGITVVWFSSIPHSMIIINLLALESVFLVLGSLALPHLTQLKGY